MLGKGYGTVQTVISFCSFKNNYFLKNWAIHWLFFFILVFSLQLIVNNIGNDWLRTTGLWYWKRPLYQLHHNDYPSKLTT